MEPDDYALQKAGFKVTRVDKRQGKKWNSTHTESEPSPQHPRQRPKKGQNRADFSSFLNFQIKKPPTQPVLSMPQRPRTQPAYRNITLSPYFRFALKFPADYSQFHVDPSLPLDWDNVQWVTKLTENEATCPICLEADLTAPRVSRCGHCFCFPCVLQYLAHGERQDKRCPVCFDTVKAAALKPVEVVKTKGVSEGYTATFSLVRRRKGTISVYACGQPTVGHVYQDFPSADSNQALFNRMCISFDPRSVWDKHLAQLSSVRESIDQEFGSKAFTITETERGRLPEPALVHVPPYNASCDCCKVIHPLNLTVVDATVCPTHGQNTEELVYDCRVVTESADPPRDEGSYYYFYQLSDGQPYFLHPLTNRALVKQFGSWGALPVSLTARVLEVEDATMSEYNARRFNHLCKGTAFYLVELDLSNICSPDTLALIADETESRRRARCQHKQREDRQQQTITRRKEEQEKQTQHEFYHLPIPEQTPFVNEYSLCRPLLPVAQEPQSIWSSFKPGKTESAKKPAEKKPQAKKPGQRRKTSDPDYEDLVADESYSQYIVETNQHSLSDFVFK